MRISSFIIALTSLCSLTAAAEIIPTPTGAKITLDSVTTEVTVCSPTRVQVIKYTGEYDGARSYAAPSDFKRTAADGKYKIDTGEYYVAINEKDGNVSFWNHDGTLIMAEQHRSSSLTPVESCSCCSTKTTDKCCSSKTGKSCCSDKTAKAPRYTVRQDFQIGKSGAQSITSPDSERNLIGTLAELGTTLPSPCIVTDKGYAILWQSGIPGRMDDTPGRKVKKPGDVTFTSDSTPAITYTFIYPATPSALTSFDW